MAAVGEPFVGDHFLFTSGNSKDIEEEEEEEDDGDPEIDYKKKDLKHRMPHSVKEETRGDSKGTNGKRAQRKDKGKTRFSAYVLWAKDTRPTLSKTHPNLNFSDLNKKLGELWKDVDTNQKYMYKRQAKMANDNIRKGRSEEDVAEMKNGSGNPISKRLKTIRMEDSVNGHQSGPVQLLTIDNNHVSVSNDANGTLLYVDSKQNSQEVGETSESGDEDSHDEPCGAIKCKQPSGENLDWVQCDGCDAWFHYTCVGMMPSDALEDDQEYMCMECTNHVTLPKIPGDNSCPLCGLIYENKQILKMHMESHKGEPRYTCIDCGKGFLRSCHLVVHQRIHTCERPYVCAMCDQTFISASHLHIHRQNKHVVKKDRELGPNAVNEFWSCPSNREVLQQVKNRELDLKAAAEKLRYSYRFTYSRYKEEFGNILHNTPGKRKKEIQEFWKNILAEPTLLRVKKKDIGMKTAAKLLNCTYEFTYARYREVYGKIRKSNISNNQENNENGDISANSTEEDSPRKSVIRTDYKKETDNDIERGYMQMDQYKQAQHSEDDDDDDIEGHSMIEQRHYSDDDINVETGIESKMSKTIDNSMDTHKISTISHKEECSKISSANHEISLTEMVASISATKLKLKVSKILQSKSSETLHKYNNNRNRGNEGDQNIDKGDEQQTDKIQDDNEDKTDLNKIYFTKNKNYQVDDCENDTKRKDVKNKVHKCSYCEYESESRRALAVRLRNHTMVIE